MSNSGWIRRTVKGLIISGLICMMLNSTGCGSLPWMRKKDNIYSPKPRHQQLNKKAQKSNTKTSDTLDGFMSSERVSW